MASRKRHAGPDTWLKYLHPSPKFRYERGQIEAFEWAATVEIDPNVPVALLYEMFTGVGKTLVTYGVYWILKKRGIVDHLLVFVPTDEQRRQFAEDAQDAKDLLGIDINVLVCEKKHREITLVREGLCDVIVASYQQQDAEGDYFKNLLTDTGRWMMNDDECHHLGEGGEWYERHKNLPNIIVRLGTSATPVRHDTRRLLGLPDTPTIKVDYLEAYREKVVKRIAGHRLHYILDVTIDGQPRRLTTESLQNEGVTDFYQYEARTQLRYDQPYVHSMIMDPMLDLQQRLALAPRQHQMVFFCMTCRHAAFVCEQINMLSEQIGMGLRAEWIGVGKGLIGDTKSPEENHEIIERFKKGTFEILVQVNKVNEGFNNPRVSIGVILHLIGSQPKVLQQIGRCARRNHSLPFEQDRADIYFSADARVGELIEAMEAAANSVAGQPPDDLGGSGGGNGNGLGPWWSIPSLVLIRSEYDHTDLIVPDGLDIALYISEQDRAFMARYNITPEEWLKHFGSSRMPGAGSVPPPRPSLQTTLDSLEKQVNANHAKLAKNIVRLYQEQYGPLDKQQIGKISMMIHAQWKRRNGGNGHNRMTPEDFHAKNRWMQVENDQMEQTHEVPRWIRL